MFMFFSPCTQAYQIHEFDTKTKNHFSLGIANLLSMLSERETKCLMKTFVVYILVVLQFCFHLQNLLFEKPGRVEVLKNSRASYVHK